MTAPLQTQAQVFSSEALRWARREAPRTLVAVAAAEPQYELPALTRATPMELQAQGLLGAQAAAAALRAVNLLAAQALQQCKAETAALLARFPQPAEAVAGAYMCAQTVVTLGGR